MTFGNDLQGAVRIHFRHIVFRDWRVYSMVSHHLAIPQLNFTGFLRIWFCVVQTLYNPFHTSEMIPVRGTVRQCDIPNSQGDRQGHGFGLHAVNFTPVGFRYVIQDDRDCSFVLASGRVLGD